MGVNGSVYLAAFTSGEFAGQTPAGGRDLAAVKLDSDGNELWRWQEGTAEDDRVRSVTVDKDGSMILAGMTEGSWNSTNAGGSDVIVAKLDTNGKISWRWQAGTEGRDDSYGVSAGADGTIKVGIVVKGDWNGSSLGGTDFGAVTLFEIGSNNGTPNPTVGSSGTPAPVEFPRSPSPPSPDEFETIAPAASVVSPTQPTIFPLSAHPATPSPRVTAAPSGLHPTSSSSSSRTQSVVLIALAAVVGASVVGGLGLYLWCRHRRVRRQQLPATSNRIPVAQDGMQEGNAMSTSISTSHGQDHGLEKPPSYRSLQDTPLHRQH